MEYTKENFQNWIFYISDKMEYFTQEFALNHDLKLDYSIKSLDNIENWILSNFKNPSDILSKENAKLLDLLSIYVGETFRKYIGGKWYMNLDDKNNAYYSMPVLTSNDYKGEVYKAPIPMVTASLDRKKGNYISTILKNNMDKMGIVITK